METSESKWRLCGDKYETVNDIISEFSTLAQNEYLNGYEWGKWFTENCAKDKKLTILLISICPNQNLSIEDEIFEILQDF